MIRSKIASRFKRAKTMTFLWALLALALHVVPGAVGPVHAQGSRKDDIVFNSRGVPIGPSGAPTGTEPPIATDALYVTDGSAVYGATVSATGMIRLWQTRPTATPTWTLQ